MPEDSGLCFVVIQHLAPNHKSLMVELLQRSIRAVKEAGGMIMVQAEASAKFAGMPTSAIATGAADFILPVEEMAEQLVKFAHHPFAFIPKDPQQVIPENSSHTERICHRLREVTGMDFSLYKHATFARRIERRMNILQVHELASG